MTRIKRRPAERKAQFLDCAQALFFSRGYEATTVNDIIAAAGLSKGAFYHYFDSKEALLDSLAERVIAQALAEAEPILTDTSLGALERLNAFLAQERQWKVEHAPELRQVFAAVFRPENLLLYHRLVTASGGVIGPVLTSLIEQGVRERVFDAPAPYLVTEVLLQLSNARQALVSQAVAAVERGEIDAAVASLEARFADEEAVIARMLGLQPGQVRLVEPGFLRAVLSAMQAPPPLA